MTFQTVPFAPRAEPARPAAAPAPHPAPLPWRDFSADVLYLYGKDRKRNTLTKAKQVLRELEACGARHVSDLTPVLVARWIYETPSKGGASKGMKRADLTTKGNIAAARPIVRYAIKRGYLAHDPFEAWSFRTKNKRRNPDRHYTAEQMARVEKLVENEAKNARENATKNGLVFGPATDRISWHAHRVRALFFVAAYTGMRKMEILRLRREDVDLENNIIYVVDRAGETHGDFTDRDGLKTGGSEAPIGMPDRLSAVLEEWLSASLSDWVFPTACGSKPWTSGEKGKKPLDRLKAAFLRAGVPGGCFQGCRQTWATMGESLWGFPDGLIQRQLRHANVRTTKEHYKKADVANLAAVVKSIGFGPRTHGGDGYGA
jgi:integrase